jgi:hypothetical protein
MPPVIRHLQENPDLYKWLTGQLPPPDVMQQNAAYQVGLGALQQPCHGTKLRQKSSGLLVLFLA